MKIILNLCIGLVLIFSLFVAGCSGTGFEKRATLMPNSVGISLMQERFQGDDEAWKGITITGTWVFK